MFWVFAYDVIQWFNEAQCLYTMQFQVYLLQLPILSKYFIPASITLIDAANSS